MMIFQMIQNNSSYFFRATDTEDEFSETEPLWTINVFPPEIVFRFKPPTFFRSFVENY